MVLASTVLIILNNEKLLNNFVSIDNYDKTLHNNIFMLVYISMLLIFMTIPSVLIAVNCNPNNKIMYGFIAFIFSDIYLLQWSIRKFIFKSPNYCKI